MLYQHQNYAVSGLHGEAMLNERCKHLAIETKMVSSDVSENPEGEPNERWVVYVGYVERCGKCYERLGDGYGDPMFYVTEAEARARDEKNKEKIYGGDWNN